MFLLTNCYTINAEKRGSAVLLDRSPAIELCCDAHELWIATKPPRLVTVRAAYLSELVCSPYRPDLVAELTRAAENRLELVVSADCRDNELPVFLCKYPNQEACDYEVLLRLHASHIAEIPDVQAYIAYSQAFEDESPFAMPESIKHRHSAELAETAERLPISDGLILPIEIDSGSAITSGSILIKQRKTATLFCATLFVTSPVSIQSGTLLRRGVDWVHHKSKKRESYQSIIGSIE